MCGILTQMDQAKNEEVQRTVLIRELADQTEQEGLQWLGQVEEWMDI